VRGLLSIIVLLALLLVQTAPGIAANRETIATLTAYSGERNVVVDVFAHNEDDLFEYFNLIVFDDSKLDYVSIEADRGILWYGYYPTHVDGNRIYVHGVAGNFGDCIDPDWSEPGSPLYHVTFNVKAGQEVGFAPIGFTVEGVWDGHWNDCGGYPINPTPEYYDGGVDILGPANIISIDSNSTAPGGQVVIPVYLHNNLDVFEYFNQMLFDDSVVAVDSIVPARGLLDYGYYPTHVSGDTISVHGWAGPDNCFLADTSYPGPVLYRLHFTVHPWVPPDYEMPLIFLGNDPIWNHWVGCDLVTTDAFAANDGSIYVYNPGDVHDMGHVSGDICLESSGPNPTTQGSNIRYYLKESERVSIAIYDATGRKIRVLTHGIRDAGWHPLAWNGCNEQGQPVASGVYFFLLQTDSGSRYQKIVVVK
jgi:hypothetical protein